jgi:glycosyltransferase involved in cell wall biosynthesis
VASKTTVLLISLFHPELVRGGAQQVCYELFEGLREHPDIRPVLLASVDDKYPALYKSGARITGFDGRADEFLFLSRDYDHWWHRSSDVSLIDAFAEFLLEIQPEIIHFHHFLTYGVDLITLARKTLPKARIVFTFHEFLAICDAHGHMVRKIDHSLCTNASQVRCHQCFPERPPEDFFLRRMWLQRHFASVDAFTCPSRFMLERYADWGLPAAKIFHVPNGQRNYAQTGVTGGKAGAKAPPAATEPAETRRNRFGFFGQLVDAKGVQILLRAVALLRADGFTDFRIEINGDNARYASPEIRDEIEAFAAAEAELPVNERIVAFNGSYDTRGLANRMARVDWCVVPSIWWETFALVISEAWMFKKPVICSNVGAMADRVGDEVDGLHFEVSDPASLARALKRAATEEGLWARLVAALPEPPLREIMVNGYRTVYGLDAPPAPHAEVTKEPVEA